MAEGVDPHIQNYADRIAKGLRHDGYKNRLGPIAAQLIGSRYKVEVAPAPTTIKDISILVAEKLTKQM